MKKVIIPIIALLVLFTVTPVMTAPATRIPFTAWASFGFGNVSPGKEWTSDDGIYHVKGAVSQGDAYVYSSLGVMEGTLIMVHDLTLNSKTGLGSCHGKVVIVVPGVGTFEGSEHGTHTITDRHYISGSFVAKGTGMFDGVKMNSSYEGEMLTVDTQQVVEADMEGTLLFPNI